MAIIIDGKQIAHVLKDQIVDTVQTRLKKGHEIPGLAVILVGEDRASQIYVRHKKRACEAVGIHCQVFELAYETKEEPLLSLIEELNCDPHIQGILVQLPLPENIDAQTVIERVDPQKDIDGLHPYNLGRLAQKVPLYRPCTSYGIIQLIKAYQIDLEGKDAIVIGASRLVGRPMALELLLERCTVTICHSRTQHLPEKTRQADIVIAAVGKPEFVKGAWIKEGAVVIDVGINRLEDGRLVGDVEFEAAKTHAGWITPVPGGVGPMTIVTLLQNILKAV